MLRQGRRRTRGIRPATYSRCIHLGGPVWRCSAPTPSRPVPGCSSGTGDTGQAARQPALLPPVAHPLAAPGLGATSGPAPGAREGRL